MTARAKLLRCYPPAWRERYGDDLAAYLDDTYPWPLPLRAAASLVAGGLREWVRLARTSQGIVPAGVRVRTGVLTVLAGWATFVVAGSGFAKISEHFDSSLPARSHTVPDVAYTVVQDAATVSGLIVVVGFALSVPAFVGFLSSGGWPVIRRHVIRASVVTALTAGTTIAIGVWAHQLTASQRNGGNASYAALFLVWAGLITLTVALWTVAAIASARRLNLPRLVLLAESALATAVTIGMLVMLVAVAVWWVAMASSASSFFGGAPRFAAWTPQLMGSFALMVVALAAGAIGVVRIGRAARAL